MSYSNPDRPSVFDYYATGLWASGIAYLGILGLIAISVSVGQGAPSSMFGVLIVGGLYMAIPAIFIALLITAPLGCVIGIIMRKTLPPGHWHGAVNGGAVMGLMLGALTLFSFGFEGRWPDAGTLVFAGGLMAIGAASGWLAQRKFLNWPRVVTVSDIEVFE